MVVADDERELVGRESHAVVQQAKDAGVWVFGGGIEQGVSPVRVAGDGTITEGAYPENERLSGGFTVLELPVARRCTGVGGTLRRLLPVPARGLAVHVRPGILSRRRRRAQKPADAILESGSGRFGPCPSPPSGPMDAWRAEHDGSPPNVLLPGGVRPNSDGTPTLDHRLRRSDAERRMAMRTWRTRL